MTAYRTLNEAAQNAVDLLPDTQRAALQAVVDAHERELDCSDGPVVALAGDRVALYDAEYSCCGWAESKLMMADGPTFVIGSCHGH